MTGWWQLLGAVLRCNCPRDRLCRRRLVSERLQTGGGKDRSTGRDAREVAGERGAYGERERHAALPKEARQALEKLAGLLQHAQPLRRVPVRDVLLQCSQPHEALLEQLLQLSELILRNLVLIAWVQKQCLSRNYSNCTVVVQSVHRRAVKILTKERHGRVIKLPKTIGFKQSLYYFSNSLGPFGG